MTVDVSPAGPMAAGFGVILAGVLLLAFVGMWVAIRIQRARRQGASRPAAWIGAVSGASLAVGAVLLFGVTRMPAGSISQLPQRVKSVRDTLPVELPPILERMAGGKEQLKAQREVTKGMTESPAFVWWSLVVGSLMLCLVFGTFTGTVAWGFAMMAGRVVRGTWPLGRNPPAA